MSRQFRFLWLTGFIQLLLFSCSPLVLHSNRAEQTIYIDGKDSDWQSVPLHRFESRDAAIGLCNDSEFLYILLLFNDPMLLMQARSRGVMLEFNSPDHPGSMLTLHYTGIDSLHPSFEPEDSFWFCLNGEQKKQMIRRRNRLKDRIAVTRDGKTDFVPPDGSQGPSAARIGNPAFTGYEWKIPIGNQVNSSRLPDQDANSTMDIRIRPGKQPSGLAMDRIPGRSGFMAGPRGGREGGPVSGSAEIRFRLIMSP